MFELIVAYTNNNVQLAGSLINHLDVDMGMCQCREDPSCCTSRGLHSTTNDRDKCKIRLKLNMIRIYGFMDYRNDLLLFFFTFSARSLFFYLTFTIFSSRFVNFFL